MTEPNLIAELGAHLKEFQAEQTVSWLQLAEEAMRFLAAAGWSGEAEIIRLTAEVETWKAAVEILAKANRSQMPAIQVPLISPASQPMIQVTPTAEPWQPPQWPPSQLPPGTIICEARDGG